MDFTYHYSSTQEAFRKEVCAWLDANLPSEAARFGNQSWLLDFRTRLGEKGWLAPTEPVENGGMGASSGEQVVLAEELELRGLRPVQDRGAAALTQALHNWPSAPQLSDLISAINGGRISIWHANIPHETPEPGAGVLPFSNGMHEEGVISTEDGDDYVLNGWAWFHGPDPNPSYLWTLAHLEATDSTISLLVPAGLEGISIPVSRQLMDAPAKRVRFDQARISRSFLLGSTGDGLPLMRSTLLVASDSDVPPRLDPIVIHLQRYAETTTRQGVPLIQEPVTQQVVMEAYIEGRVAQLFQTRDAWMWATAQKNTYQAAQTRMWRKRAAQRYAQIVRQVVGVYALLDEVDPMAPARGEFATHQRESLRPDDPAGVSGSDAAIIARHLGMVRKEETERDRAPVQP